MAIVATVVAQQTNNAPLVKVPDEATAVRIAEKALANVYGRKKIEAERPFKAVLRDGIWHVGGTLYCADKQGRVTAGPCVGGVAMAEIRQTDGRVLNIKHGK